MKLYVICGHGAGDPGACGNGFQEAERVRSLGAKIKALGGDNVILGDVNRNFYVDNGISKLDTPKDYQIIELHMDSASATARGAHVIIYAQTSADMYDTALATFLSRLFPGRSQTIVGRDDLANPARAYASGYGYRLVEIGFISNADDLAIFNAKQDDIAKGILGCFGLGEQGTPVPKPQPTPETPEPSKSIDVLAQEIINGAWGNGNDRATNLTNAGYDYKAVQLRVNEILNSSTTTSKPTMPLADIANAVIRGDYGNGDARYKALDIAGYDANAVQEEVNRILRVEASVSKPGVSLDDIAHAVIRGDYGNGNERRVNLENAGYDYDVVQARVNQFL